MGFFSDLKEDLAQAVSELVPEDNGKVSKVDEEALLQAAEESMGMEHKEETTSSASFEDLPSMDGDAFVKPEYSFPDMSEFDKPIVAAKPVIEEPAVEEPAIEEPVAEEPVVTEETSSYSSDYTNSYSYSAPVEEPVAEEEPVEEYFVSDEVATITKMMTVNGDVESHGSLDVIGCVNGNISIRGKLNVTGVIKGNSEAAEFFAQNARIDGDISTTGPIKVGQDTIIKGNLYATSAVIAGAVKGDIDVHGPVILDSTAIVMGNIKSKAVQINNGAAIEGLCSQCYADVSPKAFFAE
ncbi:MAG: polymer-forming cytoskeletal protein [Lachnospiraceae bacterium]|nr:polymer-forming cytoskeletal protein [Lachnospiraceae bacterium]